MRDQVRAIEKLDDDEIAEARNAALALDESGEIVDEKAHRTAWRARQDSNLRHAA